jgi:hypothetical protein
MKEISLSVTNLNLPLRFWFHLLHHWQSNDRAVKRNSKRLSHIPCCMVFRALYSYFNTKLLHHITKLSTVKPYIIHGTQIVSISSSCFEMENRQLPTCWVHPKFGKSNHNSADTKKLTNTSERWRGLATLSKNNSALHLSASKIIIHNVFIIRNHLNSTVGTGKLNKQWKKVMRKRSADTG